MFKIVNFLVNVIFECNNCQELKFSLIILIFKPDKIKAVSSNQNSVDNFNYTSLCFEYDGGAVPPLRIDGTFRIIKFKNSKGPIYSLSINCDESLGDFFDEL